MDSEAESRTSLRDLLHILFKRKKEIISFFLTAVIVVSIGTFMVKPTYEAMSQVLVKIGRENLYVPTGTANTNQNPVISVNREEQINSEIEILKSPALLLKVADTLGPTSIYPGLEQEESWLTQTTAYITSRSRKEPLSLRQKAVLQLEKDLSVEGIKKSNVIEVQLAHEDPEMAARVLNKLVDFYMDQHLEVFKIPQSYKFFQDQSQILMSQLRDAEARLETFKKQHQVTSLDEERSLLLSQGGALQQDWNRTLSQLAETENRIVQIQQQLAATPKTVPTEEEIEHSPYVINTLHSRLVELELKEKELLTKYTEQSRLVQNVSEEIKMVRTKLTEQEARQYGRSRSGLNTTYQRLQEELFRNKAELKALNAKEQTQNSQLAGYRQKLEKLNQIEVEVRGLQRQVDVDQQNYKLYLTKFEESRISNAMDSEKIINVTQILPATPPIKPVKPKVLLNLFLGIFLGAFGGLALAFFLEYLDDSITRPEEAEAFNLPVLATIPKLRLVAVPQTSRRTKVSAMPSGTSDFSVSVILGLAFTLSAFLGLWFYFGDPNISAPVRQKITALDALPVIELSPIKADLQGTKAFSKQGVSEGQAQPNKTETGGTVNEIDKKAAQEKQTERLDPAPSTATKPGVTDRRIQMIQVGAFRNKEFALDQSAALQQKRYDARIVETKLDETRTIYRVRVLSYEDLGKPSVTINKLMNDGFDAFRVPGNKG